MNSDLLQFCIVSWGRSPQFQVPRPGMVLAFSDLGKPGPPESAEIPQSSKNFSFLVLANQCVTPEAIAAGSLPRAWRSAGPPEAGPQFKESP